MADTIQTTNTRSRIDELEKADLRFERKQDGRLKSSFRSNTENPAQRIREYDGYLARLQKDSADWLRKGDLEAADRARNQIDFEKADRASTASSRARESSRDPENKTKYDERMRSADRQVNSAELKQQASDEKYGSKWHEKRQQDDVQRQADASAHAEAARKDEEARKPLSQRLTGDDKKHYDEGREKFNALMKQPGKKGGYLDDESRSADFDRRYEDFLKAKAQQKEKAPTAEAAPAQARAGERAGRRIVQSAEAHSADGKQHKPLQKEYPGYVAERSESGKAITYVDTKSRTVAFTDSGNSLTMASDVHERNQDAQRVALLHANEKFAKLRFSGSQEYKESTARLAERLGFGDKVGNPELKDAIKQERELIARESEQKERTLAAERKAFEFEQARRAAMLPVTQKADSSDMKPATKPAERPAETSRQVTGQQASAKPETRVWDLHNENLAPPRKPESRTQATESPRQSSTPLEKPEGFDAWKAAKSETPATQAAALTTPEVTASKTAGHAPRQLAAAAPGP